MHTLASFVVTPGTRATRRSIRKFSESQPPSHAVSSCGTADAFLSHTLSSHMDGLGAEAHFWLPPEDRSSSRLANVLSHHAGECQTAARRNMMLGVKHIFSFSAALSRPPSCPASVSVCLSGPGDVFHHFPVSFLPQLLSFLHLSNGVPLGGLDLTSASNEPPPPHTQVCFFVPTVQ